MIFILTSKNMFLVGSYILPSIEILFLIQSNKLEFNSLKTNGTPKPTIESFLDELKYNFAIYNLYHK